MFHDLKNAVSNINNRTHRHTKNRKNNDANNNYNPAAVNNNNAYYNNNSNNYYPPNNVNSAQPGVGPYPYPSTGGRAGYNQYNPNYNNPNSTNIYNNSNSYNNNNNNPTYPTRTRNSDNYNVDLPGTNFYDENSESTSQVHYVGANNIKQRNSGQYSMETGSLMPATSAASVVMTRPVALPAPPPSPLLQAIIEHVCYFRQCSVPPAIFPEVVLAFDEYISRGSVMDKFIHNSPPHPRFFAIRFLDLNYSAMYENNAAPTLGPYGQPRQGTVPNVPEPVLAYFKSSRNRCMRKFFPLVDLCGVLTAGDVKPPQNVPPNADDAAKKEKGSSANKKSKKKRSTYASEIKTVFDHPLVQQRLCSSGLLRGMQKGVSTKYVKTDCLMVFHFRSRVSAGEEYTALLAPNPTVYLAWSVVMRFIAELR